MNRFLWPLKIAAKIVLSRLPFGYALWQKLGLFRLGKMDTAHYAAKIFRLHAGHAFPQGFPPGFTALELGPGDSIASALLAAGAGADKVYLIDVGAFAHRDPAAYKALARELREKGMNAPDIESARSFEDILRLCNAVYLTGGLASLRELPDNSVDFIWSHSVLEHVRVHEFAEEMRELRRLLKPAGRASHNINYKDHLAEALNNLRFSDALWESDFFVRSGFYTNRLRHHEIMDVFRREGYKVMFEETGVWPALPTPRTALAPRFQAMNDAQLLIRTAHAVLSKGE